MRKFANDGTRIHLKVFGSERGSVMERLTMTNDKGQGAFTFDLHVHCEPSEMRKIIKLADKLREYEDLEEQGLLIRLPCKVGDVVYKIWHRKCHNGVDYPDSYECCGCEDECDLRTDIFEFTIPSVDWILDHRNVFDSKWMWFRTKEEAEHALERRKKC